MSVLSATPRAKRREPLDDKAVGKIDIDNKIIGGLFGLEEPLGVSTSEAPFLNEDSLFLVNARSGIRLVVETLSPPAVWLPSYLCPAIVEALRGTQTQTSFYALDEQLAQPSRKWLDEIHAGDLVLVIDFFGFPWDAQWVREVQERGARVLEDACQALLTPAIGSSADFVVLSPRKFVGVPDGGILSCKEGQSFESLQLQPPPPHWWLKTWFATVLRREFDLHGADRRWFDIFRESEAQAPVGRYAMSELARLLLTGAVSYSNVAQRRVDNYAVLGQALGHLALFPSLPAGVVPLGFPIRLKNRDRIQQKLFAQQIYPPVHWSLEGVVPPEFEQSHRLSAEILTLPCDQRYGKADMERMGRAVLQELKS